MRVHDSQAYRKTDVTKERISRILELRETQHDSDLRQALKGEPRSSGISTDGSLISASAVPHRGDSSQLKVLYDSLYYPFKNNETYNVYKKNK